MRKKFNKDEHWKEILMHSIFRSCEFVDDLSLVRQIFNGGEIEGPFVGLPLPEGVGIVLLYIDGSLYSVTTRCRRIKPFLDVTHWLGGTGLFPKRIPRGLTNRNPVKVYGTLTLSVEDYNLCLLKHYVGKKEPRFHHFVYRLITKYRLGDWDLSSLQFFPHSTNMLGYSYKKEFCNLMGELGFTLFDQIVDVELEKEYANKNLRLVDIDSIGNNVPHNKVLYNGDRSYVWSGLLVLINDIRRWRYPFSRRKSFSQHGFVVRQPSVCKISYITDIDYFTDTTGSARAVLRVEPVVINDHVIKSTNMVSPRLIKEMNLTIGSKVLLTTKAGGVPHLIGLKDKDKYNVHG